MTHKPSTQYKFIGHKEDLPRNQTSRKFLYMTFDDGPNFGTEIVLDAFKEAGGNGTFFVDCLRICTCETQETAQQTRQHY